MGADVCWVCAVHQAHFSGLSPWPLDQACGMNTPKMLQGPVLPPASDFTDPVSTRSQGDDMAERTQGHSESFSSHGQWAPLTHQTCEDSKAHGGDRWKHVLPHGGNSDI
jgi:hypothetical protein